jgi:hypothetical protein
MLAGRQRILGAMVVLAAAGCDTAHREPSRASPEEELAAINFLLRIKTCSGSVVPPFSEGQLQFWVETWKDGELVSSKGGGSGQFPWSRTMRYVAAAQETPGTSPSMEIALHVPGANSFSAVLRADLPRVEGTGFFLTLPQERAAPDATEVDLLVLLRTNACGSTVPRSRYAGKDSQKDPALVLRARFLKPE